MIDILFEKFSNFVRDDYEGVSDNKIYRLYLCLIKDMLVVSFENNASKSFMRGFFKILNNKTFTDYLSSVTKTQIQPVIKRNLCAFLLFIIAYTSIFP